MARASYEIMSVTPDGQDIGIDIILIRDLDRGMSVTNDAETVVEEVIQFMHTVIMNDRPFRIHYYDTEGRKDELLHDGIRFTGFKSLDR